MIYFIRCGDAVKIGYTRDGPEARLAQLQAANPVELSIIRIVSGGHRLERALHIRFKALRIRGEWFAFHEDMLTVEISGPLYSTDNTWTRTRETKPRKRNLTDEQVRAIRADKRDSEVIAEAYGISRVHVYNIKAGRRKALVSDAKPEGKGG